VSDRKIKTAPQRLHLRAREVPEGEDPVVVTPASAGWSFAGLRVVELRPGEERFFSTGSTEMAIIPLAGSCVVRCDGQQFVLQGRPNVFDRVSDFAYVPIDADVVLASARGGRFALPCAEATRRLEPMYGPAEDVPVEVRGAGQATRQVNNFLAPGSFPADKLVAVEVLTPGGNWSSYPPHKHDEARQGESILEEIYYFETMRLSSKEEMDPTIGSGFGLQRLYTVDGDIDLCAEVVHGDVVLIPRGYHGPSVAPPGYHLYYLNVLAGPAAERSMDFCDDPEHHWIRSTWPAIPRDDRLPLCTSEGRRVIEL
jgi:5-deoxy-glucuronate isomerase